MTTVTFDQIGRHAWASRTLGSTYPAPVLCVMARRQAGLTQRELASLLNTHRSTIAKVENGLLPMSEALLRRWAHATAADESLLRSDLLPIGA